MLVNPDSHTRLLLCPCWKMLEPVAPGDGFREYAAAPPAAYSSASIATVVGIFVESQPPAPTVRLWFAEDAFRYSPLIWLLIPGIRLPRESAGRRRRVRKAPKLALWRVAAYREPGPPSPTIRKGASAARGFALAFHCTSAHNHPTPSVLRAVFLESGLSRY